MSKSRIGAVLLAALALAAFTGWLWRRASGNATPVSEFAAAREAIERNDLATARELIDALLVRTPDHAEALLYRGQLRRSAGNLDGALQDWRRIPDNPPNTGGTARFLEATAFMEQGRARQAEELFRRAIELHPTYIQPHERLLELYIVQMRRDEAREQMRIVGQMRPLTYKEIVFEMVAVERVTTPESGVTLTRSYLTADSDDHQSRLALARYLIEAERFSEAVAVLEERWAELSADPRAAAILGEALAKSGRADDAVAVLAGWEPQRAASADLSRALGHAALAREDWPLAVECFSAVVAARPEDSASLYRLGQALQRNGQADEARDVLRRANTEDELQREALRLVWGDAEKSDHITQIVVRVAGLLHELGRTADAAFWYQRALILDPTATAAAEGLKKLRDAGATPEQGEPPSQALAAATRGPAANPAEARLPRVVRTPPESTPAPTAPIALRDMHAEAGIDFVYFNGDSGFKYLVESTGGGVAVLDYDADGWPDMCFTQGCRFPYAPDDQTYVDRLYRNRGEGTFYDVARQAGTADNRYGQGCTAGDYDGDGFSDLIIANYGRCSFFRNNGDGTFSDVTEAAGLTRERMSSSLALADLDLDGLLDLYVVNYTSSLKVCRNADGTYGTCNPSNFEGEPDQLLRNLGDGRFEDVTEASGAVGENGKGLGIVVADFDLDGRPDIYVANDTTPNFLFRNRTEQPGAMQFVEEGLISGTALSGEGRAQAGMGVACADFDGNGWQDLHVTNFYQETNTLYLNQGGGMFVDATRAAELAAPTFPMLGFGTQAADFDLDGLPDLFVANGHIDNFSDRGEPWKMPPQLFRNRGGARFADVSQQSGDYFAGEYLGRGVARLDWNRDLLPDLAVVHQDRPVALLSNETDVPRRAVAIRLRGGPSNREGIGVRLIADCGGRLQHIDVCGGDGFFAANEKQQLIGLGTADQVDRLEVIWPLGKRQVFNDLPAGNVVTITEGWDAPVVRPPPPVR